MNMTVKAFSPEGFEITLSADVRSMGEALQFTANAAQAGFTPVPEVGKRKSEIITVVIRREKVNDDGSVTPVVDLYPAWGVRNYGQYRFSFVYLNSEAQIREFEDRAWVKLDDMPLFDNQQPYKRHPKRKASMEVVCKPFVAIKEYGGEKDIGGRMQHTWDFAGYGEIPGKADAAPAPATAQKPTLPPQNKTARPPVQLPPPGQIRPAVPPQSAIPTNQGSPLRTAN